MIQVFVVVSLVCRAPLFSFCLVTDGRVKKEQNIYAMHETVKLL